MWPRASCPAASHQRLLHARGVVTLYCTEGFVRALSFTENMTHLCIEPMHENCLYTL